MNLSTKDLKTLTWNTVAERQLAEDLLEAHRLLKEQSDTLLTIAQMPIIYVCQYVRDKAMFKWEKSKEWI